MFTRKNQLSITQRSLVVDLKNQGLSYGAITKATGYSRSTICSVNQKFQTFGTVANLSGQGGDGQIDIAIHQRQSKNVGRPSRAASQRPLRGHHHAPNRPESPAPSQSPIPRHLTDKHKKARLAFALEHRHKPIDFCGRTNPNSARSTCPVKRSSSAASEERSSSVVAMSCSGAAWRRPDKAASNSSTRG